ncbi:MAG: hypothetical protein AAGA58_00005, partial [Verrucomicrobiota bacterium]
MSHPYFETSRLLFEVLFTPRKVKHGHIFHPGRLDEELTSQVSRLLLSSRENFEPWAGYKLCGGFRADYYLSWKEASKQWEAVVCLGCGEVIFYHDGDTL